uniref:ANK_REP_REGION domain-containing protein n=1 Tax=Angiostrongylus cantonensis TaxID=6313 RepID=A0A0K0DFQ3_ANGCA
LCRNFSADDETSSSTDSVDSDDGDVPLKSSSSHVYFVHKDEVFSIYRCILHPGESTVSVTVFGRPLDCAIFLLAGGHFAAGVFTADKMTAHKAFHRYVVRAKQGSVQSVNDRSKGAARSAGATLRRYNERALREDIVTVLTSWSVHLAHTPLIFIRCASYQRVIFHESDEGGFDRKDPRLRQVENALFIFRTIPFETKRPLVDEVRRVWERLSSVFRHGTVNDFMAERNRRKQRAKVLLKKKKPNFQWTPEDELDERGPQEKKMDRLKPAVNAHDQLREIDPWPSLHKNARRELYTLVKDNNVDALREFVNGRNEEDKNEVLSYLSSFRFSSDSDTFLHMAAKSGCGEVVQYLLEAGCNPSIKNGNDMVAFAVSANKAIKKVFINFRSENPNKWNWAR